MKNKKAAPARAAEKKKSVHTYYRQNDDGSIDFSLLSEVGDDRPIIPYLRVSGYYTNWRQLLTEQLEEIRDAAAGRVVLKAEQDVNKGWKIKRKGLRRAVKRARKLGAMIVAVDLDRLLRHRKFHYTRNPRVRPNAEQIETFLAAYPGVTFAVVVPVEKIKSERTKRGQRYTRNKGGRPATAGYKKRRKQETLNFVLELRAHGFGYGSISHFTEIPKATVERWVKRHFQASHFSSQI